MMMMMMMMIMPDLSTRPKMTPPTTPIMVARVIPEDLAHDTIFSLEGRCNEMVVVVVGGGTAGGVGDSGGVGDLSDNDGDSVAGVVIVAVVADLEMVIVAEGGSPGVSQSGRVAPLGSVSHK